MAKRKFPGELDDAARTYLDEIDRKVRWADGLMTARSVGQKATWVVALLAGAAVTLSDALEWWSWWTPVLGFVVVVAQGSDRLFARSSPTALAKESMRRALGKERRLFYAAAPPYRDADDRFALFVERTEAALDRYDEALLEATERESRGGG